MKSFHPVIALACFCFGLSACHSYEYLSGEQDYALYLNRKHVYVMNLQTKSDSLVYFSRGFPGKLSDDGVIGYRQVPVQQFVSDSALYSKNGNARYVMKDGIRYRVLRDGESTLICIEKDITRVPYADIRQIKLKQINKTRTTVLVLGISLPVAWLIYYAITHMGYDM